MLVAGGLMVSLLGPDLNHRLLPHLFFSVYPYILVVPYCYLACKKLMNSKIQMGMVFTTWIKGTMAIRTRRMTG